MQKDAVENVYQQLDELKTEMVTAAEVLSNLEPGISILGSARASRESKYWQLTYEIASMLSKAGFNIISGGGPGIMEAANKAAFDNQGTSIGLNIKLPFESKDNGYQTQPLYFQYFMSRKNTFFMHSMGFIVMPGGFGTLDEVCETLTLIQTNKIPEVPIVFVGTEFWKPLLDWFSNTMLDLGFIHARDLNLFKVMDDPQEILNYFNDYRLSRKAQTICQP